MHPGCHREDENIVNGGIPPDQTENQKGWHWYIIMQHDGHVLCKNLQSRHHEHEDGNETNHEKSIEHFLKNLYTLVKLDTCFEPGNRISFSNISDKPKNRKFVYFVLQVFLNRGKHDVHDF